MARAYRKRGMPITLEWLRSQCVENEETGCWNWQGRCSRGGYGHVSHRGRTQRTHRVAFELSGGVLSPEADVVRHSCHNRRCCNPEHLAAGTHLMNMRDMVHSGRAARGEQNGNARLQEAQILEIRASSGSLRAIAKVFGVGRMTISNIKSGRAWKHLTNEPSRLAA